MLKPLARTLETLALGGNKLGGTITGDIAAFTKLTELRLFDMNLKGTFVVLTPVRVAPTLRDGTESEISHTFPPFPRCSGAIPESIGNLKKLEYLSLAENALSGA